MKKALLTFSLITAAIFANAQIQPTANLTIFSEDGYKFYLILNGERQNNAPETNIRVEELVNPYYSAKIIFEDKTMGEISKSALMLTDADGVYQDVTYKIKKDKNGKMLLRYFSSIPVVPNMPPPSRPQGVPVYQFGAPSHAPIIINNNNVVTQTTTQTTTGVGTTNSVGVNVGGMGVGINVNINEPTINQNVTTTQTVTTTTTGRPAGQPDPKPYYSGGCQGYPMNGNDFLSAQEAIKDGSFEDTKLTTAKQIADANCLSTDQIASICSLFSFEDSKLNFSKYAYKRCLDRQNYYKLNKVFSFDSSETDLSKFVANNK